MSYDISQPIPQGSDGAQDAENSRISAITDELKRLCAVYEAQRGDCVEDVNRFETEQRAAEQREVMQMSLHPCSREQKLAQIANLRQHSATTKESANAERSRK
jgi:hypothetical protein